MKGFMVLEDGTRWAVEATGTGCEVPRNIQLVQSLDREFGLAEYQRLANRFAEECFDGCDAIEYPYPDSELPTRQLGPLVEEDQKHMDKWRSHGDSSELLKALWPKRQLENMVYADSPFMKLITPELPEPARKRWYEFDLAEAQQVKKAWEETWPEMKQYISAVDQLTGRTPPIVAAATPPPAGGFRKDDEVLLQGKWWRLGVVDPTNGSWVATTSGGDLSVIYRDELVGAAWKRFGYGNPTQSELPAHSRSATVCRCPIKDLTSIGHTDPQCPERKK